MMLRVIAMLVLLALPVQAETVRVSSGEHTNFSRLVFALPAAYGWQLGRTPDGYELALDGAAPRFDVSTVFDLIPKNRLVGIFVDPASGNLRLTLDCDCHAVPFSLDAKTIVIDLRDGPPPEGSSFETGLDGVILPPLQDKSSGTLRPRSRVPQTAPQQPQYDWLSLGPAPRVPVVAFPIPDLSGVQSNLRETLVAQLADGASRNVVDLAIEQTPANTDDVPYLSDAVPIRLTSSLGLQIGDPEEDVAPIQPDGQTCLSDDALAVESWITEEAAPTPYAGLAQDLVGEFDKPQKDAVTAAAQRYIYLGFGAEARALLNAFPDDSDERAMLYNLSFLVDGEPAPATNVFAGMQPCDTAAAFWALLSDGPQSKEDLSDAAVKRTFSALPPHLRQHLGPLVISMLLDRGANNLATEISQVMGRGKPEDSRAAALANSELLLADGRAAEALPQVQEVLADPGQLKAEALITLVDVQIAAGNPIEPGVAATLEAMLEEYESHPLHADMARAYGLALAGSGQFADARALADEGAALTPDFWSLLAQNADDDTLLLQAVQTPALPEEVPEAAGQRIAERLAGLGFPESAAAWRALFPDASALMASSSFTQEGVAEVKPAATPVSAETGTPASVENEPAPAEPDAVPAAERVARWNQDWDSVAAGEDGTWTALASRLNAQDPGETTPSLASANETLAESQEVRALITSLLAETQENPLAP